MKTIVIYVVAATLFNAAAMTGNMVLLAMSVLGLFVAHRHTKTLTLRPMKKDFYEKEM